MSDTLAQDRSHKGDVGLLGLLDTERGLTLATASRIYEHRIEASAHLRFLRFDVSQLFL